MRYKDPLVEQAAQNAGRTQDDLRSEMEPTSPVHAQSPPFFFRTSARNKQHLARWYTHSGTTVHGTPFEAHGMRALCGLLRNPRHTPAETLQPYHRLCRVCFPVDPARTEVTSLGLDRVQEDAFAALADEGSAVVVGWAAYSDVRRGYFREGTSRVSEDLLLATLFGSREEAWGNSPAGFERMAPVALVPLPDRDPE